MALKCTSHAVYATRYHLGWALKYRKGIRREEIRRRMGELVRESLGLRSRNWGAQDHVHLFLNVPPKYAVAEAGERAGCWRSIRHRGPTGGDEFWEDGHFVRMVGD